MDREGKLSREVEQLWGGTVTAQQASAGCRPANPQSPVASANLDPGLGGRVELDAGIKETQGETSRALSAL